MFRRRNLLMVRMSGLRRPVQRLTFYSLGFLTFISSGATAFGQTVAPQDPTEPLRRYPIEFMVDRPSANTDPVNLLRLDSLHPSDELQIKVDPTLARNW